MGGVIRQNSRERWSTRRTERGTWAVQYDKTGRFSKYSDKEFDSPIEATLALKHKELNFTREWLSEQPTPPPKAAEKKAKAKKEVEKPPPAEAEISPEVKFKKGDIITDGLINGRVIGEGTIKFAKKNLPAYKVEVLTGHEKGQTSLMSMRDAKSLEGKIEIGKKADKEQWDDFLKLGRKVDLVKKAGWVTKTGKLSKTGEKIAESKWDDLSPAAQKILSSEIERLYAPPEKQKGGLFEKEEAELPFGGEPGILKSMAPKRGKAAAIPTAKPPKAEGGIKKIQERAKHVYKTTSDPREAGYILDDGSMLDFSGRHYATGYKESKPLPGKPDYLRGQRNVDHREIEIEEIFGPIKESMSGGEAMILFETEGNALRFALSNGEDLNVSFIETQDISESQWKRLGKIQKETRGTIYYDIYDSKDNRIFSGETEQVWRVKRDFESFQVPKPPRPPSEGGRVLPQKEVQRRETEALPAIVPKPVPPGSRRDALIKRTQKALGIPIRHGKFRERAHGVYKQKAKVIRIKKPQDVEVAMHEAGHHIQALLGIRDTQLPQQITNLAYEKAKNKKKEGFAEFVRFYVTDYEQAKSRAPWFFDQFESALATQPDLQDTLLSVRQAWEEYQASPSVSKVASMIVTGGNEKKPHTWNEIYTWMKDSLRPLQVISQRIEQKGVKLKPQEDPFVLATLLRGWTRKANQYLQWGTFQIKPDAAQGVEFTGPSLAEIIEPVERAGRRELLDAYLISKRALADDRILKGFEGIISKADFEQTVKELEPEFKDTAKQLYDYSDELLTYLTDSGRISQELADRIREKNLFYAPLYRVMDAEVPLPGTGKKQIGNLFNPIKRLKGSSREIYSPSESLLYNTYAMMNAAERNRIGEALIKIADKEGMGDIIEKIPFPMKPENVPLEQIQKQLEKRFDTDELRAAFDEFGVDLTDESITIWKPHYRTGPNEAIFYNKGKAELYELDPDLHAAIMQTDAGAQHIFIKILSYPAKFRRAGATTFSPEFAIRNPARDQLTAFIQSKYGITPGVDFMRGLSAILKQSEEWQLYNSSGAAHAAIVSTDRNYIKKHLRQIIRRKSPKNVIKNPLEAMQMLSELTEEATRVGEFMKALKKEGRGLEGILKAAGAAREVTLDFQRIGAKTKGINLVTAFWNARLEGVDKMVRTFRDHPARATAKSFLGVTLPSLLLWWAQKDDPAYQELPHWRRILFWNIVTHNEDGSVKRIWAIPKPFEYGILFGSVPEMFLDWRYQKDPDAIGEAMKALWEGVWPGIIPTGLEIFAELWANKSFFFDRPIVPRGKEELEPELQAAPYTSETVKLIAKGMAKLPGLEKIASPAKIEHFIRATTAALGRMSLESTDEILKRTGLVDVAPEPSMTLSDIPGIRGFAVRFPTANSKSIEQFYKRYIKAKTQWESRKERAGIRGYGIKGLKPPRQLKQYETTAKMLSLLRKTANIVYENKAMDPEEKRKTLDGIYFTMINTSRVALGKKPSDFKKRQNR